MKDQTIEEMMEKMLKESAERTEARNAKPVQDANPNFNQKAYDLLQSEGY